MACVPLRYSVVIFAKRRSSMEITSSRRAWAFS
jgi:hypothetical protein